MKIAILINGSIRKFESVKSDVEKSFSNYEHQIFISEYPGHLKQLCSDALSHGFNHIIFVGGDGTLNEGLNSLIEHFRIGDSNLPESIDWQAIKNIKIGVYAAGSGNDFIKSVDLDESIDTLINNIDSNSSRLVDVGWLQSYNEQKQKQSSYFINIADVGIGGEVLLAKSKMPKWLSGKMTYFLSIVKTMLTFKKCKLRAYNNDFNWSGEALNLIVANAKYFGNSLGIAPDADVSDGHFSLVIIGEVGLLTYLLNLKNLKKCRKLVHEKISYYKVKEIIVEPADSRQIIIDMDGEMVGFAPMHLKCLAGRINFIC